MNREIKFRVWNGIDMEKNIMVGFGLALYVDVDHNGDICDPDDSASLSQFNSFYDESTPVMQYTGLKDKKGVEIYEGDIVDLGQTVNGCSSFVVMWDAAAARFTAKYNCNMKRTRTYEYDMSEFFHVCPITDEGLEVVGNIYQTPELLK